MKHLLILLLSGIATPALAQQPSAATPPAAAPATVTCTPEHAAMGHCKLPAPAPAPAPAQAQQPAKPPPPATCTPEHAAMGHCKLPAPAPAQAQQPAKQPPPATCTPEHAAMGHCTLSPPVQQPQPPAQQAPTTPPACTPEHAAMGHCKLPAQPQPGADPHAGHQMETAAAPPKGPPPPEARTGPEHAADTVFDPAAMAESREELRRHHGDLPAYRFLVERAETRFREGRDGYLVDGQAWYGGDIDKIWFKGEVEGGWGEKPEHVEAQALWSHAIDPWFDLQTGIRVDPQPGPDRAHLVLGVQGLAPYWWEVDGALFLSNKGEVTARAEAEHDMRITQKLILQPRAELDFSLQDIPELGIGAGLSQAALGLRLRYQFSPLFAPYAGVEYERAFGDTRRFQEEEGEVPGSWNFVVGLRTWF